MWLWLDAQDQGQLVWDRKTEGVHFPFALQPELMLRQGFGEMKVLKQRIRDVLQPSKSLGHSDRQA